MFIQRDYFQTIVMKATNDLCSFFYQRKNPLIDWQSVEFEIRKLDPNFQKCQDILQFIGKLLPWLGERKRNRLAPWEASTDGKLKIGSMQVANSMNQLKRFWLDQLIWPGFIEGTSLGYYQPNGSYKFRSFLRFVGQMKLEKGKEWRVFYLKKGKSDNLKNFISWLFVKPESKANPHNSLYIMYDAEKIVGIKKGKKGEDNVVTMYEKIFLHELGHARTKLEFYLQELKSGKTQIKAHPSHEFEAWIYALVVRSIIVSTRSWISQLLRGTDEEWRAPS